jgi:hypothetical protein
MFAPFMSLLIVLLHRLVFNFEIQGCGKQGCQMQQHELERKCPLTSQKLPICFNTLFDYAV